jgi:hypothetical protein
MKDGVHESSQNRNSRHDLPTPVLSVQIDLIMIFQLTRVSNKQEFDQAATSQQAATGSTRRGYKVGAFTRSTHALCSETYKS